MNRTSLIVFGIFIAFFISWAGLVLGAYFQLGHYLPEVDETTGEQSPPGFSGQYEQGRAVYAANGCVYCHSQQVRPGADIERKWGDRRTVARDYSRDTAAYLGNQRIGPDLANIGARKDEKNPNKYTAAWHYQHLYQPQVVSPGSIMPPMRFLFEKRKIAGQRSLNALKIEGEDAEDLAADEEVVPTQQAQDLVAYLLQLKRSGYPLPEAPPEPAQP